MLAHMRVLGLRLYAKKSVLSPVQRTAILGAKTMQAQLYPARIESNEARPIIHFETVPETVRSDSSSIQRIIFGSTA